MEFCTERSGEALLTELVCSSICGGASDALGRRRVMNRFQFVVPWGDDDRQIMSKCKDPGWHFWEHQFCGAERSVTRMLAHHVWEDKESGADAHR